MLLVLLLSEISHFHSTTEYIQIGNILDQYFIVEDVMECSKLNNNCPRNPFRCEYVANSVAVDVLMI